MSAFHRNHSMNGWKFIESLESRVLLSITPTITVQPAVLTGGSIVVGGTVEDTTNGTNVRSTPAGTVVGTVDADVRGSVLAGPETASLDGESFTWWDVKWPNLQGWVAANFLENVYADLVPENLTLLPTGGGAGSTVQVNFKIDDIGNGASLATTANIVLSASSTAPSDTDPILGSVNVNALAEDDGTESFSPDVTIPAGTTSGSYFIWVVPDPGGTANQGPNAGTDISAPFTVAPPPAAPTDVTASEGTIPHHVAITWNAVSGATAYQVYRSTVNDFSNATKIAGALTSPSYNDTTAAPGIAHFYWVRARNAGGPGPAGGPATGYVPLAAPSVTVTDDAKHIALTWAAVTNADTYQVWRSTTNDESTATKIAGPITTLFFDDSDVVSGQQYFYWVRAKNSATGAGLFSVVEMGELAA
jgi:hypothetical protein